MKVRWVLSLFVISIAGCATRPISPKAPTPPVSSSVSSPINHRVTLPYTFTRHGVEIRVSSIEFATSQVLVNITLQEMRGETVDLLASPLVQAFYAGGNALPYLSYTRADHVLTDPAIHLASREQFPITLNYQAAVGSTDVPGKPLELRFPTGKYWSSQVSD